MKKISQNLYMKWKKQTEKESDKLCCKKSTQKKAEG